MSIGISSMGIVADFAGVTFLLGYTSVNPSDKCFASEAKMDCGGGPPLSWSVSEIPKWWFAVGILLDGVHIGVSTCGEHHSIEAGDLARRDGSPDTISLEKPAGCSPNVGGIVAIAPGADFKGSRIGNHITE